MKTLKDILLLPLMNRCHEVAKYFDLACLKDLHDSFPLLIRSLFYDEGGLGWRLRFLTHDHTPDQFEALYNFFDPINGPLFRMVYRLTAESLKYLVPFNDLPEKLQGELHSRVISPFYKDMVFIDPYLHQIVGLQMSAFDYFLYYFALHGTNPLDMTTPYLPHHEPLKSLYVSLAALYVCTFLPTDTRYTVLPQNVQTLFRTMPGFITSKRPKKAIKYLLPHRLGLNVSSEPSEALQPESVAQYVHWRSTSIMCIFLDVWFGMDARSASRLPPVVQIRCMRVLVKQLHAFGIFADIRDSVSFPELSKASRDILSTYFNESFIGIFSRWPLYDDTLIDVVELWLSYIQPWRYHPSLDKSGGPITERSYEQFIAQNLAIYTQPFVMLMTRVLDADFSRVNNANLLYRPCRVFAQNELLPLLRQRERELLELKRSDTTSPRVTGRSVEPTEQQHQQTGQLLYVPLFSHETALALEKALRKVRWTIALLKKNRDRIGPLQWVLQQFHLPPYQEQRREEENVVARLTFAEQMLVKMFDLPSAAENIYAYPVCSDWDKSMDTNNAYLLTADDWMDPALQPIESGENAFLVRFLHTVSSKLQLMFGAEIESFWQHYRVSRKLVRQLLLPPRTINRFVWNPNGSKQWTTVDLPARICLRFLASYKVLALIVCSLLLGGVLFGAPSYGFIVLILLLLSGNLLLSGLAKQ